MAADLTEGSSALPAWQRPLRAGMEFMACVATAPCTGAGTNEPRRKKPKVTADELAQSSNTISTASSCESFRCPGSLVDVGHLGPQGVYRPVTRNGIPSPQHCGPSPGCIEMGGDCGSAGSHEPGASNYRPGSIVPRDAPFCSPFTPTGTNEKAESSNSCLPEQRPAKRYRICGKTKP